MRERNATMRMGFSVLAGLLGLASCSSCGGESVAFGQGEVASHTTVYLGSLAKKLEPLHAKMGPPSPGDWLAEHDEKGQSFKQYVKSDPVRPGDGLTTLYIQPIGDMDGEYAELMGLTAEFMRIWFGVPVETLEPVAEDVIPAKARRISPVTGKEQILTTWVLHDLLEPGRPEDALGVLAMTRVDLWAGKGWNFVFGQASLSQRVGVWSLSRFGDPSDDEQYPLVLERTLATAVHETGHMLGMKHCISWMCAMNGSNSLEESDAQPLHLCPVCLRKLWWATKVDPVQRFSSLADFCDANGLAEQAGFYRQSALVIGADAADE